MQKEIDRENVVAVLGEINSYFRSSFDAMDGGTLACEAFRRYAEAAERAIALLKAQEPVEPTELDEDNTRYCGDCGAPVGYEVLGPAGLDYIQYSYCPSCGRPVKWE